MVQEQLRARGIGNERVLAAMSKVPREEFATTESLTQAYGDYPLPIAAGQTVSQPYIVASMIEALASVHRTRSLRSEREPDTKPRSWVSWPQKCGRFERVPELAQRRGNILATWATPTFTWCEGDGSLGLPEQAPFPKILVAAAAPAAPAEPDRPTG